MNKTFKIVFNKARGTLMVTNETTSSVQKKGGGHWSQPPLRPWRFSPHPPLALKISTTKHSPALR